MSELLNWIITALLILAFISVAWWTLKQLDLPAPIIKMVYVLIGIMVMIFIASLVGGYMPAPHFVAIR